MLSHYRTSLHTVADPVARLTKATRQIAAEVGIPVGRITRWYRESEDFKQMLSETEASVVEAVRDAIVAEQQQTIIYLLPAARETLARSLDPEADIPASVRVTAAAHVYRLAG